MTSSYNNTPDDAQTRAPISQNPLFDGTAEVGDKFISGSRVWIWDGDKWDLQHIVVEGDETIKQGPPGEVGKSAYQSYLDTTDDEIPLTEKEWVESLKGRDGEDGEDGADGADGIGADGGQGGQGEQGPPGKDGAAICENTDAPPTGGPRGKLWIDSLNQIYVTLKG